MSVLAAPAPKKPWELIPNWLPLGVLIFSLIAFGVRADSQIRDIRVKTDGYDKMMIDRTDRMARMETQLSNIEKTQDRILQKLDEK